MMARKHSPAFRLLTDFDTGAADVVMPDRQAEIKSALEDGYQRGLADGRAEAQADAELRLAEAETLFLERIGLEREAFRRECADVLVARFEDAVRSIEGAVSERVAILLRPWLIDQLRERAVHDLEQAIARTLTEDAKVHIEAPAEVLEHLRERLPGGAFQIGYSPSPTSDIRAHIADTAIDLNITAWLAELEAMTP